MKIGILLYDGFSAMDVAAMQEPLRLAALQQQKSDFFPKLVARSAQVMDRSGRQETADVVSEDLRTFDVLLLPGCSPQALSERLQQSEWIDWLKTASDRATLASAEANAELWAAAGKRPEKWASMGDTSRLFFVPANGDVFAMTLRLIESIHPELSQGQFQALFHRSAPIQRTAAYQRNTAETQISANLNLDGSGQYQLNSGIPFLDHMLQQIAVHGMLDLSLDANGDLEVDVHHTVEDIAIVLGKMIQQALGDRKGIQRCASVRVPMDESLAEVTLDLSGRPYCVFHCVWQQNEVAGIPVSLFKHFFETLSVHAACNLHIYVPYGEDGHHQIEAIFKAFARALNQAVQRDPRRLQQIPSSKGVLSA